MTVCINKLKLKSIMTVSLFSAYAKQLESMLNKKIDLLTQLRGKKIRHFIGYVS